jgi:DNA-binding protein HU-beta
MNKVQLIQRVAKEARVKKSQASRSVKALVKTIREALRVGDKVSLSGLGTFKVKSRKARKGRNPKTGETIQIPVGRKVSFKPSFSLKKLVRLSTAPLATPAAPYIPPPQAA